MKNTETRTLERPQMCEIKEIIKESPTVKTFILNKEFNFKGGQFAMVWVPEYDEKPFGFSNKNGFSVANVGRTTSKMHEMQEGELLGIRGPYGNGFETFGDNIIAVAGGIGSAPIIPTVEEFAKQNIDVTTILGGRTKEELLFLDRFENASNTIPCTDDGTFGYNGFTTNKLMEILEQRKEENISTDCLITCGPEIMMKKVVEIAKNYNIPVQLSLERYMKCGIGICGQCSVDDEGYCICKDGPVFWDNKLNMIKEFGKYRRDASGAKI
ncbi:dihydroorotate dehydrogenase electron transfer subunit [Methanococcus voltae PS]|uniref:Probable dihydroorotate dehydrogenase B (NAD(+)), electron transfer subunit n=1 Tax=Methanococcus voltae PS TaxID=523842 RepID=A0ABT2EUX5_METVO|nr:dihydroorotate dehydrogenase electron transfer subunit [Methanococcus voltae PS]